MPTRALLTVALTANAASSRFIRLAVMLDGNLASQGMGLSVTAKAVAPRIAVDSQGA